MSDKDDLRREREQLRRQIEADDAASTIAYDMSRFCAGAVAGSRGGASNTCSILVLRQAKIYGL